MPSSPVAKAYLSGTAKPGAVGEAGSETDDGWRASDYEVNRHRRRRGQTLKRKSNGFGRRNETRRSYSGEWVCHHKIIVVREREERKMKKNWSCDRIWEWQWWIELNWTTFLSLSLVIEKWKEDELQGKWREEKRQLPML